MTDQPNTNPILQGALLVVDVQRGFDEPYWGARNNPACEASIGRLIGLWRVHSLPVVFVRHDSTERNSPLRPDRPGNAFKKIVSGPADLVVSKSVHSAFHGEPALHTWLGERRIQTVTICGITTNHCCETTARVACDLGYQVQFVLDATHTFDRRDVEGRVIAADQISRVTAANLQDEFANVVSARDFLSPSAPPAP